MSRGPGHVERYLRDLQAQNPPLLTAPIIHLAAWIFDCPVLAVRDSQRSSVDRAFKKVTGKTWQQYRKQAKTPVKLPERKSSIVRAAHAEELLTDNMLDQFASKKALRKPRRPRVNLSTEEIQCEEHNLVRVLDTIVRLRENGSTRDELAYFYEECERIRQKLDRLRAESYAKRDKEAAEKEAELEEARNTADSRRTRLMRVLYPWERPARFRPKPKPETTITLESIGLAEEYDELEAGGTPLSIAPPQD